MTEPTSEIFEVVWPSTQSRVDRIESVEGLDGLNGKRIAYIWDYRFKGTEMWDLITGELSKLYPGVEFVGHEVFGNIHSDDEVELVGALPEKLRDHRVDAAVVGVGA